MSAGKAHWLRAGETQLWSAEQLRNLSPEVVEQLALCSYARIVNPSDGFRIFVHGGGLVGVLLCFGNGSSTLRARMVFRSIA